MPNCIGSDNILTLIFKLIAMPWLAENDNDNVLKQGVGEFHCMSMQFCAQFKCMLNDGAEAHLK